MPTLADAPSLAAFQRYVAQLEVERGFEHESIVDKCLLMGEEVGELFKAVRKAQGIAIGPNSAVAPIGDELADVFIYLCAIANRAGVDLEAAFRDKERRNHGRVWTPAADVDP